MTADPVVLGAFFMNVLVGFYRAVECLIDYF